MADAVEDTANPAALLVTGFALRACTAARSWAGCRVQCLPHSDVFSALRRLFRPPTPSPRLRGCVSEAEERAAVDDGEDGLDAAHPLLAMDSKARAIAVTAAAAAAPALFVPGEAPI